MSFGCDEAPETACIPFPPRARTALPPELAITLATVPFGVVAGGTGKVGEVGAAFHTWTIAIRFVAEVDRAMRGGIASGTGTGSEIETAFWTASGIETGIEIGSETWTDAIGIESVRSIDGSDLSVEMI